jgi:hypothetical protein
MLKHSHLSDIKKRLLNLCVAIALLASPIFAQEQVPIDDGITNNNSTTNDNGNDIEGDFSNNYEDSTVESNNQSEVINYNGAGSSPGSSPVMSSIAPTIMGGGGNDSCLIPKSRGIQLNIVGISEGEMQQDPHCNRRKNARLLGLPQQVGGLGLQVSAISVMCQDATVFRSMMLANTPCPINDSRTGRLLMGKNAIMKYRENPALFVVGYELDKEFWNTLLKVGEEYNEEFVEDTTTKRSLSDQFRSSKRNKSTSSAPTTNTRTGSGNKPKPVNDGAGKD